MEWKVALGIRALTPYLVGDAASSNIPIALFHVQVENRESIALDIEHRIGFPAPARVDSAGHLAGA